MIKNYCIKIISSVFVMLTIFMVSTSVFATELSEQYSNYYTLGGSLNSLGIDVNAVKTELCTKDGLNEEDYYICVYKLNLTNIATGEHYVFFLKSKTSTTNTSFRYSSSNNFYFLEGGFYNYYAIYKISTSKWNYFTSTGNAGYTSFKSFPITIYSETQTDLYYNDGSKLTKIYDWQEVYADNTEKKIIYEVNYSEDNKTAVLSAEIKNTSYGDKLYYSLLGYKLNGKLMNPIELSQSQATVITLNKNTVIHLQALDSER